MFAALLAHFRLVPIYVLLFSTTDCGATHWVRGETDHYKEGLFFLTIFPLFGCFFLGLIWGSMFLKSGQGDEEAKELTAEELEEEAKWKKWQLWQRIKLSLILLALVSIPPVGSLIFSRAEVNDQHYRLVFQTTEANGVEIRYEEISEIHLISRDRGSLAYIVCVRHDGEEVEFRYYNFAKESGDKFLEYAREKGIPIRDNRGKEH